MEVGLFDLDDEVRPDVPQDLGGAPQRRMLSPLEIELQQRETATIRRADRRVQRRELHRLDAARFTFARPEVVEARPRDVERPERRLPGRRRQRERDDLDLNHPIERHVLGEAQPHLPRRLEGDDLARRPDDAGGGQGEQPDVGAAVDEDVPGREELLGKLDVGVAVAVAIKEKPERRPQIGVDGGASSVIRHPRGPQGTDLLANEAGEHAQPGPNGGNLPGWIIESHEDHRG